LIDAGPPSTWRHLTLKDVATWSSGGTPKAGTKEYYGGNIPWAVIGDLNDGQVTTTASTITEAGLSNSSAKVVAPGTLLVAMYGSIGKLGIAGVPMATNQAIACAVPNVDVELGYLFHYIRSQRKALLHAGKGGAQQNISQTVLKAWPIPVPSVEEQRRIAAYLGELETRRAWVAGRLASARATIERVRAAVLGSEFAALERTAPLVPLERVLREPLKNGYSARPVARVTPTRVLTLTATTSGYFDPVHFKYTDEEIPADSPLWLEPGDVLIQRGNTAELVGMPAMYDGAGGEFIYPDLMIRARISQAADPRYVWYMLLAPQARAFLRDRAIGTAGNMPKVNQKAVNAVPLPLPSREKQNEVVSRVAAALDAADRCGNAISAAEHALTGTASAGLAKAFRGELVPAESEPDLA
jgi:type I restriction enzyme S subunit